MTINNIKAMAAALWILGVGTAGLLADVTSPSGWLVFVGSATVPPLIMILYWIHPDRVPSQSTRQVRR